MKPFFTPILLGLATYVASRAIHGPFRSATTTSLLPTLHLRDLLLNTTNNSATIATGDSTDPDEDWQLDSDSEDDGADQELTPEQQEALWCKFKNRGYQLTKAMMMSDQDAANMLAWPYTQSPWDGDLREDLKKWGYNDDYEGDVISDGYCDFDRKHGLATAFQDLGVDSRSSAQGGPNHCFYVEHNDGPTIHRDEDGELPDHSEQYYPVDGKDFRVTTAYARVGINRVDGLVYFLHRQSPEDAALENWGRKPSPDELPLLRSSSDIAWGMWNRVAFGTQQLNYFMSLSIINDETGYAINRILQQSGISQLPKWPGKDFEFAVKETGDGPDKELDLLRSEAAFVLLGSPNGLAAGYFLIQHRRQLGWKHIWKVRVWEEGEGEWATPNLLFYVSDRNPWEGADPQRQLEEQMNDLEISRAQKRRRKRDLSNAQVPSAVHASDDGKHIVREHVIIARL